MILTNGQIYQYAINLISAFSDKNQQLPAKLNFYIQRNMKTLFSLTEEIDEVRKTIVSKYGVETEENQIYKIAPENVASAQQELDDLFAISQDVAILQIPLGNITNDILLSMEQMEALLFMIEED